MNNIKLTMNPETAAVLREIARLTTLPECEIVRLHLAPMEAQWHELLALVESHPELKEQAANLVASYGPESILDGIQRIAPPGYLTLAARFERDVEASLAAPAIVH